MDSCNIVDIYWNKSQLKQRPMYKNNAFYFLTVYLPFCLSLFNGGTGSQESLDTLWVGFAGTLREKKKDESSVNKIK